MRTTCHWQAAVFGGLLAFAAAAVATPDDAPDKAPAVVSPKAFGLVEDFANVAGLTAAGWVIENRTFSPGPRTWYQGNTGNFTAQAGPANSYAAVDVLSSSADANTISNWLITPAVEFESGSTLSFYTRKTSTPPDRLEVRVSTNGQSSNTGNTAETVGDFTTLLLRINPDLEAGGYPTAWTRYTLGNADGLPSSGSGRIAFRYYVTNAGINSPNGGYIGIDSVSIQPAPRYTVRGAVGGLEGSGFALTLNDGTPLPIAANGLFTFPDQLLAGTAYVVAVHTSPAAPAQDCTVTNPSGTITGNVSNVSVFCTVRTYKVGGNVSGLAGSGLVLDMQDSMGLWELPLSQNGDFQFPQNVPDHSPYDVGIVSQPVHPSQTCAIANHEGAIASADIDDIVVACATNQFTVGGQVSGLAGSGLQLQLNGGTPMPIAGDGGFVFPPMPDLSSYDVVVVTQPSQLSQTCTVADGGGALDGENVTNIAVACTTDTFRIGGTVRGLVGEGFVARLNFASDLPIAANGEFAFSNRLPDGSDYHVNHGGQPTNPHQTCQFAGGEGTVAGADVSDIVVTCITDRFVVGGSVTGVEGHGLVLQINGGGDIDVPGDGMFFFGNATVEDQASFHVTILAQPRQPAQTCVLDEATASGTIDNAHVDNLQLTCSTDPFSLRVSYGTPQQALVGELYDMPLTVEALDGNAEPLWFGEVRFEAPVSGPSAVLEGPTGELGPAVSVPLEGSHEAAVYPRANAIGGCYGVVAHLDGAPAPVVFELTNIDPTPPGPIILEDGFETPPATAKGLPVCGN